MRGLILAGGVDTCCRPLTEITRKHPHLKWMAATPPITAGLIGRLPLLSFDCSLSESDIDAAATSPSRVVT
jgi:hypothetical protein